MCVKFFCNDCGKEIYENMEEKKKKDFTIFMFENICYCEGCTREVIESGKHKKKEKIEKQRFLNNIAWIMDARNNKEKAFEYAKNHIANVE